MVDVNDFFRNIFNVYSDDKFSYENLYRYVGIKEFENIFEKNQIYFTNPKDWRSSDKFEVYFENWWMNDNNLKIVYEQLSNSINRSYAKLGLDLDSTQYRNAVFSSMAACMGVLQQDAYCYCVANTYREPKMIEEYHKKYKRNIIVKFKPYFFNKISLLSDGRFVPNGTGFLCADVFPMDYRESIEDFISALAGQQMNPNTIISMFLNRGAFLKHNSFQYEHEVRIKLRIMCPDKMNIIMASNIYGLIFDRTDINEIVDICMSFLSKWKDEFNEPYREIADRIVKIGDKENFYLQLENGIASKIIESIYLHKGAEDTEKGYVKTLCCREHIPISEIDFEREVVR